MLSSPRAALVPAEGTALALAELAGGEDEAAELNERRERTDNSSNSSRSRPPSPPPFLLLSLRLLPLLVPLLVPTTTSFRARSIAEPAAVASQQQQALLQSLSPFRHPLLPQAMAAVS